MALHRAQAPIASAEEFHQLLQATPLDRLRLLDVRAVTSVIWWQVLARHPEHAVWVAVNRHIGPELIAHLAADPRLQVRVAIASNPATGEALMAELAHDKSDLVRMRVACHAHATREVLAHLVADPCVVVSRHAQARLQHDLNGVQLPASYLDEVSMSDLLH